MTAPKSLYQLVEKFERNKDQYKHQNYNESNVRAEFVDPLFEALGWNMRDSSQVKREGQVRIWGRVKHPDYSFMADRGAAFYVETKKPSINLRDSAESAVQLRAYGWSGNTEVGILTDFEEFVVYDCRVEPKAGDSANAARVWLTTYEHYIEQWEELAKYFSRDAVQAGEHRAILESKPRGIFGVDAAFLRDMERWRETLAKDIAQRNPNLNQRELNLLVQRTIDRIVFLRIAEDRRIEPYGRLERTAGEGRRVYEELKILFREADDKYNSGLFHFNPDAARASEADDLSMKIIVGSDPLRSIIRELYPWQSLYQFSVIPADILGQVYERFLGKVIELSEDGQAQVTDKPEVRKAGGVYYTPTYIVDYIVENTVGKLLKGKTPTQVAKLRILDPACGSGSFLTGAYQYLLDWHLDYYRQHPQRFRNRRRETTEGFVLTTAEKRRILLNNIYGVDLDQNAVKVSKLALLLKMLENESDATGRQTIMFSAGGQILPDLSSNIKWGNSLIGMDFYSGKQVGMFDEEAMYRLKAFDWEDEKRGFGEIMDGGGFDVVIGNPPYGAWFDGEQGTYFTENYNVFKGVKDVYVAFIEKALELTALQGLISFIVPSAWTGGPRYQKLRGFLIKYAFESIVLLPYDVFADAYVDTLVFVLRKYENNQDHRVLTYVYDKRDRVKNIDLSRNEWDVIRQAEWQDIENCKFVLDSQTIKILSKINQSCKNRLSDIVHIKRGVLFDKKLLTDSKVSKESHPYFEGDVYRYRMNYKAENWIEFNDSIKEKPKEFTWFEGERILLRRLVNRRQRLMAILAKPTFITNKNLYSILKSQNVGLHTILALLNSRLFSYLYLKQVTQATKDDFPQVTIRDIKSLPIPSMASLEAMNDNMVTLVETMLDLHKQLPGLSGIRLDTVKAQIESTDRRIDRLVYRLYGLTADEIAIVENK